MTAVDTQLARTFRAARWAESGGKPVCPDCFEGDALVIDQPPRLKQPGLHSYRCRDCNQRFSDFSGTCLRGSADSLRDWALALFTLAGHPTEVRGTGLNQRIVPIELGPPTPRLARLRSRLETSVLLRSAWRLQLSKAGFTLNRLRYRRAA